MAGLLDAFGQGFDSPQSAAIQALAGGLLQGNFGAGLMGANQAYGASKQNALKMQLLQAQMAETQAQAEERRMKITMAQQAAADRDRFMNGDPNGVAPGAFITPPDGQGPVLPQGSAPMKGGLLGYADALGIPQNQIRADVLFNGGKKVSDFINDRSKPNWINVNGNLVNSNAKGFEGGLQDGMSASNDGRVTAWRKGQDGNMVVGAPTGALETYGAYRGVDERAKAGADLVKVVGDDGAERYVTREQAVSAAQPQQRPPVQPRSNMSRPMMPVAGESDRFAILTQELSKAVASGNTGDISAIQSEIARLPASAKTGANPSGLATPGFRASPSTNQKLSAEAGGDINKSWLKTSYEPSVTAGGAARDLIDTVQVTRQAMANMGSTGWGTQAKAAGAAVLSGLGIAPNNAKMFAANAEVFQKTAMERLWLTLNEAKGPQTEGDAARASKTYASLANTPKANEFILDFAEAKATRDQIKAKFYQQAMPIAKSKGDLSEVDREWAKRAPSIFNMPTMQTWGGGIK